MAPALIDGDVIITIKPRVICAGLIYVIDHPDLGQIIKRVESLDRRGRAQLSGDSPASTPAALLGTVETSRIKRRALFALRKGRLVRL
jgi:hypothetical protein